MMVIVLNTQQWQEVETNPLKYNHFSEIVYLLRFEDKENKKNKEDKKDKDDKENKEAENYKKNEENKENIHVTSPQQTNPVK